MPPKLSRDKTLEGLSGDRRTARLRSDLEERLRQLWYQNPRFRIIRDHRLRILSAQRARVDDWQEWETGLRYQTMEAMLQMWSQFELDVGWAPDDDIKGTFRHRFNNPDGHIVYTALHNRMGEVAQAFRLRQIWLDRQDEEIPDPEAERGNEHALNTITGLALRGISNSRHPFTDVDGLRLVVRDLYLVERLIASMTAADSWDTQQAMFPLLDLRSGLRNQVLLARLLITEDMLNDRMLSPQAFAQESSLLANPDARDPQPSLRAQRLEDLHDELTLEVEAMREVTTAIAAIPLDGTVIPPREPGEPPERSARLAARDSIAGLEAAYIMYATLNTRPVWLSFYLSQLRAWEPLPGERDAWRELFPPDFDVPELVDVIGHQSRMGDRDGTYITAGVGAMINQINMRYNTNFRENGMAERIDIRFPPEPTIPVPWKRYLVKRTDQRKAAAELQLPDRGDQFDDMFTAPDPLTNPITGQPDISMRANFLQSDAGLQIIRNAQTPEEAMEQIHYRFWGIFAYLAAIGPDNAREVLQVGHPGGVESLLHAAFLNMRGMVIARFGEQMSADPGRYYDRFERQRWIPAGYFPAGLLDNGTILWGQTNDPSQPPEPYPFSAIFSVDAHWTLGPPTWDRRRLYDEAVPVEIRNHMWDLEDAVEGPGTEALPDPGGSGPGGLDPVDVPPHPINLPPLPPETEDDGDVNRPAAAPLAGPAPAPPDREDGNVNFGAGHMPPQRPRDEDMSAPPPVPNPVPEAADSPIQALLNSLPARFMGHVEADRAHGAGAGALMSASDFGATMRRGLDSLYAQFTDMFRDSHLGGRVVHPPPASPEARARRRTLIETQAQVVDLADRTAALRRLVGDPNIAANVRERLNFEVTQIRQHLVRYFRQLRERADGRAVSTSRMADVDRRLAGIAGRIVDAESYLRESGIVPPSDLRSDDWDRLHSVEHLAGAAGIIDSAESILRQGEGLYADDTGRSLWEMAATLRNHISALGGSGAVSPLRLTTSQVLDAADRIFAMASSWQAMHRAEAAETQDEVYNAVRNELRNVRLSLDLPVGVDAAVGHEIGVLNDAIDSIRHPRAAAIRGREQQELMERWMRGQPDAFLSPLAVGDPPNYGLNAADLGGRSGDSPEQRAAALLAVHLHGDDANSVADSFMRSAAGMAAGLAAADDSMRNALGQFAGTVRVFVEAGYETASALARGLVAAMPGLSPIPIDRITDIVRNAATAGWDRTAIAFSRAYADVEGAIATASGIAANVDMTAQAITHLVFGLRGLGAAGLTDDGGALQREAGLAMTAALAADFISSMIRQTNRIVFAPEPLLPPAFPPTSPPPRPLDVLLDDMDDSIDDDAHDQNDPGLLQRRRDRARRRGLWEQRRRDEEILRQMGPLPGPPNPGPPGPNPLPPAGPPVPAGPPGPAPPAVPTEPFIPHPGDTGWLESFRRLVWDTVNDPLPAALSAMLGRGLGNLYAHDGHDMSLEEPEDDNIGPAFGPEPDPHPGSGPEFGPDPDPHGPEFGPEPGPLGPEFGPDQHPSGPEFGPRHVSRQRDARFWPNDQPGGGQWDRQMDEWYDEPEDDPEEEWYDEPDDDPGRDDDILDDDDDGGAPWHDPDVLHRPHPAGASGTIHGRSEESMANITNKRRRLIHDVRFIAV